MNFKVLGIFGLSMMLTGCAATASVNKSAGPVSVHDTTDQTFKKDVLEANRPVFVDFYATWCGPCKIMAPIVDRLSQKYQGRLVVLRVDVDKNPGIATALGVQSIPTFAIFKNGKPVAATAGVMPEQVLSSKIDASL